MLNRNLEHALNELFKHAKSEGHEFLSVEHLLMCLLKDGQTLKALRSANLPTEGLVRRLEEWVDAYTPKLNQSEDCEPQPTLGFQRVLQRAVFHVQSSGRKEVTGLNVLVAIFSEQDSEAVSILAEHGVARSDIVSLAESLADQASPTMTTTRPATEQQMQNLEAKLDQILDAMHALSNEVKRLADHRDQD